MFLYSSSKLFCAKDVVNSIKAIDKGINSGISGKTCSFVKKASSYKEANSDGKDVVYLRL